jgi:hypothetical protein
MNYNKDQLRLNECKPLSQTYFKKGGINSETRFNEVLLSTVLDKYDSKLNGWKRRVLAITEETIDLFRPYNSLDISPTRLVLKRRIFYKHLRALTTSTHSKSLLLHLTVDSDLLLRSIDYHAKIDEILTLIKDVAS